jgi:hypothetical protein
MIISPTGTPISQATYMAWLKQNNMSPMDRLTDSQESEINLLAASDPVTIAELAEKAACVAAKKAADVAKEVEIARITDGLDRETVMAMAKKPLADVQGYWPEINGDMMTLRNTRDQKIVWNIGDDNWSNPISTRGNRDDSGAGYGANQ